MTKDEALLKLALWHHAMAKKPNRNQAKREKHEATAKFIEEAFAQPDGRSFAEVHPRNPDATCKCEHWQSCIYCHPTAHTEKYITDAMKVRQAVSEAVWQQSEQTPIGYLCENAVGHQYFRWKKPSSVYKPIALYAAPLQPEQEPYRFTDKENWLSGNGRMWSDMHREDGDFPVYTTPPHSFFEDVADELRVEIAKLQDHIRLLEKQLAQPQRTWVGLTDDQINQAYADSYKGILLHEAIEAKLKENNNG